MTGWKPALAVAFCALLPCVCAAYTAEEEGRARIVTGGDRWVAGSDNPFEIEYTVGSKGIAAGGGVAVAFPHALNIEPRLQPDQPNYVKVLCDIPSVKVEYRTWAHTSFPKVSDINSPSHNLRHGIFVTASQKAFKAGQTIKFVFGADGKGMRIPPQLCEYPFRVAVDLEGSGKYYAIRDCPKTAIVGGQLDHLFVTVPSTRAAGEEVDVCVRAEDEFNNLVRDCGAGVVLSGIPALPKSPRKLVRGVGHVVVKAPSPGVYHVTARSGPLTARSNPMVVGAKPPTYGVYWGDIHGHTQLSDGLGKDADYYYDYAREAADLDVCATAEHAYHEEARVASRKHNRPGEFVTIWGFEWSENLPGRLDRNIYFRNEEVAIPKGWPKVTEDWWKMLDQHYGDNKNHDVIVGPHMFTYKTASKPWYETWNPAFERFAEIYSEHGMSEFKGNPRMLAGGDVQDGFFAQDGLKYGPRFGFIGSSDTHDSHPGRGSNSLVNRGGLVAFLAKDLTRESIWDAFWSRRVYAATTERIFIDFRIDGHVMGEEFSTTGKPRISYTIHGCDDRFEVSVIKNNQVLRGTKTTSGSANESFVDDSFTDSSCYYLRVAQDNGEWAWSSPIWVDRVR